MSFLAEGEGRNTFSKGLLFRDEIQLDSFSTLWERNDDEYGVI